MTPEECYPQLKTILEKFNITVSEQNLFNPVVKVQSGFCKVRGKSFYILDKHLSARMKCLQLASFLKQLPLDSVYIMPAIREYIENA
jgi:hypothetical protein